MVEVVPERTIAELLELARLTGSDTGAQRVAWSDVWVTANEWLRQKLVDASLSSEVDPAGNVWATIPGASPQAIVLGGHLDSVPDGGWLDGCLGVLAGLEVLRELRAERDLPLTVKLVSWADEEGARFGRSLFGSTACAGLLDVNDVARLRDHDGVLLPDALAMCGVALEAVPDASRFLSNAVAYLELHIEQGPVLELERVPLGAVVGAYGVERGRVTLHGQASHAGATPMVMRRDPVVAAAQIVLGLRESALRLKGLATVGEFDAYPGTPTAIAARCSFSVDQRHVEASVLNEMKAELWTLIGRTGWEERRVEYTHLLSAAPVKFDEQLISVCESAIRDVSGASYRLPSGPLHDAVAVSRAGVPTAMIFVQSKGGLSHSALEDSSREHIAFGVRALHVATRRVIDQLAGRR